MRREFREVEVDQLQGFLAPVRSFSGGHRHVRFHFRHGLMNSLGQKTDIFVGTLNVVERSLGTMMAHFIAFLPGQLVFDQFTTISNA